MSHVKFLFAFLAFISMNSSQVFAQGPRLPPEHPELDDDTRISGSSLNGVTPKPYVCGYGTIHFVGLGAMGANRSPGQWGKLMVAPEFMPNIHDHPEVYGETTYGTKVIQIGKSESERSDFLYKMKTLLIATSTNTPIRITSARLECNAGLSGGYEIRLCSNGDEYCLRDH